MTHIIGIALGGISAAVFACSVIGTVMRLRRFADAVDPKPAHGKHRATRRSAR